LSASYLYNHVLQTYRECDPDVDVVDRMLIQPSAALADLTHHGASRESLMPFTIDSHRLPSSAALEDASALACDLRRVMQYELDTAPEADDWKRVKTSLRERGPAVFVVQTFVDMKCGVGEDYEVVPELHTESHRRGQHAFLCVGYEDEHVRAKDGVRVGSFLLMSSWGVDWGKGGFVWMPYSVLLGDGQGERPLRQAWYLARAPLASCPDVPEGDCVAQRWLAGDETPHAPERYRTCAPLGDAPVPFEDVEVPVTLELTQSEADLRGPAIPCVPSLFEARFTFTDVTDPSTVPPPSAGHPPGLPYRVDPSEVRIFAERIGAWVPLQPLRILDRARTPAQIVVRAEAFRPGPGGHLFRRRTIRVTVVR
jgi:hypothetical protein